VDGQEPRSADITINAVRSVAHVHALASVWNPLVDASSSRNIFLTWEWMTTWLDIFAAKSEPFILTVTDADGSLTGLAPLYSTRMRVGPLTARALRLMGTGVGADHMGFIWSGRDFTEQIVLRLIDDIDDWDVLDFTWMNADQARRATEAVHRRERTHACLLTEADKCPVLRLPASWDVYVKALSTSFRSSLRRSLQRLNRDHGPVEFLQVATEGEFEAAWDALVVFHRKRWLSRGFHGAFADPVFTAFHHRFGPVALRKGWLRFYVLRVAEEIAAALYCFRFGSCVCYFQSSFDSAWSHYGPGRLLMAHAIRRAIEEGAAEFDFLRGTERHKMHWKPELTGDCHLVIFRRELRISVPIVVKGWVRHAQRFARLMP